MHVGICWCAHALSSTAVFGQDFVHMVMILWIKPKPATTDVTIFFCYWRAFVIASIYGLKENVLIGLKDCFHDRRKYVTSGVRLYLYF